MGCGSDRGKVAYAIQKNTANFAARIVKHQQRFERCRTRGGVQMTPVEVDCVSRRG